MNMFSNVPFLYVGIKKVLNPLPDCLTPLCHITDRALAPDTDPHCRISFRKKKKNSKQRAGGWGHFQDCSGRKGRGCISFSVKSVF